MSSHPPQTISDLVRRGLFIDGEWRSGAETLANVNPSDLDDVIGHAPQGRSLDMADAIGAAARAFPAWAAETPDRRGEVLDRAGELLKQRSAAYGELLAREEGKTLAEAVGEVRRAAAILKFFAGEAVRMTGDHLRAWRAGTDIDIIREPVGVFGLITPWNFPIAIPAWKTAPALAFGNTVVLKPAELTPACASVLAAVLDEAGLPPGVFNLVCGVGAEVGRTLCEHADVAGVSFTGSDATGRAVASAVAGRGARVQMEMGGKNPLLVMDDADLDLAVELAANGAFFSTGQRCTATSRLIVHRTIHDTFVERLVERIERLRVGHALNPATEIGPLADGGPFSKVTKAVDRASGEGAEIVAGGRALECDTRGWFYAPTLLLRTNRAMQINQEEVFGPVATVLQIDDLDEGIEEANATRFGLSAGIATRSLKSAARFRREVRAGMVMINLPTAGVNDPHVPFGGSKASSFGPREQGAYARDFYTTTKTAFVAA